MNRRWTWGAALLVLALAGGWAAKQWRPAPPAVAVKAEAPLAALQLTEADWLTVSERTLARGVDINGSLKAVRSAFVKARVAGEILEIAVREGESVRAGQLLVRIDPTELDLRLRQTEHNVQAARAQLDIAQRALANSQALVAQGFVSPTTLDTALANRAASDAALQAAQAAVDLARKARADATLVAPLAGVVAQRLAQPGERIGIDGRLLEIVDLSQIELEASVPQEVAPRIRPGALASLRIDGLDAPLSARVARLNPSAQAGTRAVMVYLTVPAHPALRHGLFARGQIALEERKALAVPVSAVRIDQSLPYVLELVATPAGGWQVRQRPVQLGLRGQVRAETEGAVADRSEHVELLSGVAAGARVLAERAGLLRDGAAVTPSASAVAR